MLIEFKVSNFRSFKEIVTLSMVASADKEHLEANTIPIDKKLRLLKSAVIYGANASGKSNLFEAMDFMKDMVINSSKDSQASEPIQVDQFRLSTETENQPSTFEAVFLIDGIRYRYGFQVDDKRVHNEWLFFVPTIREATLFTREGDTIKCSNHFKEGKGLEEKTRENALFLSVAAQFNGAISKQVLDWFHSFRILSAHDRQNQQVYTFFKLNDPGFLKFALEFLKAADMGIKNIKINSVPITEESLPEKLPQDIKKAILTAVERVDVAKNIEIKSVHSKYNSKKEVISEEHFDFEFDESAGTKALFYLAAPIYYSLKNNEVMIIDELTSKLHPLLTEAIIKAYHCAKSEVQSSGGSNAQLIFISHDTSILTNRTFRRDQIWFTQKDEYGVTDLYSLEEYRVRKDASFNKDYMMGKYGAIPFIGDIETVFK